MIELVCVRHGRTEWNADLRFQGQTNVPLDERGLAQAAALSALLERERFDYAVSSDLGRAAETARAIVRAHPGLALQFDPELREMAFGTWEGLTWAEIVAGDPALVADGFHRPKFYTPPGGESFEAVVEAAGRAVARVRAALPSGGTALLVSHAGVLHALLRVVLGQEEGAALEVRFSPASVTRFSLRSDGTGILVALNETSPVA